MRFHGHYVALNEVIMTNWPLFLTVFHCAGKRSPQECFHLVNQTGICSCLIGFLARIRF